MSSLEVALRAISWIWAFHFFKDSNSFTPELFQKALKFLYQHGRHLEKYLSTYYSPNTHLTGEALGLYYLGTQFPFFNRAENWRKLGEEILFAELDRQILKDGVYFEQSTWYQRYTADFYTHFLILKTLNGETSDELQNKLVEPNCNNIRFFDVYNATRRHDAVYRRRRRRQNVCRYSRTRNNDFRASLATGAILFDRGDYKFVAENFAEETLWLFGRKAVLQL